MNKRLKELRVKLNLNQREFSSRVDLSQPALAMIEKGSRVLRDIHISRIASEFNINENWLRTGDGEMFVRSEVFSLDEKARLHNLTDLEIDIMRGYMELPPETRNHLVAMFDSVYGKHREAAATIDPTPEQIAEEEAEAYRKEVLAELKTQKSSASEERKGKSS